MGRRKLKSVQGQVMYEVYTPTLTQEQVKERRARLLDAYDRLPDYLQNRVAARANLLEDRFGMDSDLAFVTAYTSIAGETM